MRIIRWILSKLYPLSPLSIAPRASRDPARRRGLRRRPPPAVRAALIGVCRRAPRQPTCPAPHGSSRALLRRRPRRLLEPKLKIENKFSTFFCKILVNIFAAKCWQCFSIQLFKKMLFNTFLCKMLKIFVAIIGGVVDGSVREENNKSLNGF